MSVSVPYIPPNIGVFGLGRTGNSVYQSLSKIAKVICYDQDSSSREAFAKIYGDADIVSLSDPRWLVLDKIVLSPGVSLSHEIVKIADAHNIAITSDVDLLFDKSPLANFIAITGTNGKTTTTALIGHILRFCDFNYPIGGNIGTPVLTLESGCAGYVLELSSFQLDLLKSFKAKIALLLNITPDHLDRYRSMENYISAKKKIFDRMELDSFAVINVDNDLTNQIFLELKEENRINLLPISVTQSLSKGIFINDNILYDNIFEAMIIPLPKNKSLQGLHNQENIVASYAGCRVMGLPAEQIMEAIQSFQGLPHRMQYIGTIADINFYNDSKATNAMAASKSISSLDNIYWLAGGIAKEGGVRDLLPWISNIRKAYIFGQDRDIFALALDGKVEFQIYQDLTEAFDKAFIEAKKNKKGIKNILLAPACASYDQFKNFEKRGDLFIKLCNNKITEYS